MVEEVENRSHALLSASGASRWLNCTASPRFEEQFPDSSSEYAEEGTVAHEVGELLAKWLLGFLSLEEFNSSIKIQQESKYYSIEMTDYMQAYAGFIQEAAEQAGTPENPATVELEVRLDFSEFAPEGFGTGDCIIVNHGFLHIIDLKYGKGIRVDGKDNSQMKLYALGALARYDMIYDIKKVKMSIYQPRISEFASEDEISVEELLKWGHEVIKPKAEEAFSGKGVFSPGKETCRFCRGKKVCQARNQGHLDFLENHFASGTILELSLEEASDILFQAEDIKQWLSELEEKVTNSLKSGKEVQGWKLVEGRSTRGWSDIVAVEECLMKSGIPQEEFSIATLLSVSKLEKSLGKKVVNDLLGDYIRKPKGKATLVLETDKRKSICVKEEVLSMFDDGYTEKL